ncbi:MAG: primosomal protein N' [Eubacterium sp.]|nr:primosomal protein N' [Eubacterium sp.]
MNGEIAEVIVDISVDSLDRPFEYIIPESMADEVREGTPVVIPFGRGNRELRGYVIRIKDTSVWDPAKLKEIIGVHHGEVPIEGQLLSLAAWIRTHYGGTMNEAIRTVLPVRTKVKSVEEHWLNLIITPEEAGIVADEEGKKHHVAKERLIRALIAEGELSAARARNEYKTTNSVIESLKSAGVITVTDVRKERRPDELASAKQDKTATVNLNDEQQTAVDTVLEDYRAGIRKTYLLYGVTGSGKTEVYIEILKNILSEGRQAIVLIPEIALTHQMVERFATVFGDRVSVLHSRMSAGERYDQFVRAEKHEIDIVVGPRSALFVPFDRLGMIVVDEEHENSYQSEKSPTYHAVEVALERARRSNASVVLGSATPSVNSYREATEGRYTMLCLKERATGASLPQVHVIDLREELKAKNHSILSRLLHKKLAERLNRGEQSMLFINRRGYAGFVSCRSCGYVVKCSHCDVSMTEHRSGRGSRLVCHYCGSEQAMPAKCPECGSPYIAAFGLGTEKVCELVQKEFPEARILRMDADTTKNKGGHERVLAPFREGEADILVGTQMIVKGHDLPHVTLVGAIAADLSLHQADFHSYERTFQLLRQAGGRAGRGDLPGEFVIQTYQPEAYCIQAVATDDDNRFYEQELCFRELGGYPPFSRMLMLRVSSVDEKRARKLADRIAEIVDKTDSKKLQRIGPAPDRLPFINDQHRIALFIKASDESEIDGAMRRIDSELNGSDLLRDCYFHYERE